MKNMTPRAEARAAGERYYETGIPCKQGHIARRTTISGSCTVCTQLAAAAWVAARPEKPATYSAAYRARNSDKVRALDAAAKKAGRRAQPEKHKAYRTARYAAQQLAQGRVVNPANRTSIAEVMARLFTAHMGAIVYVSGFTSMLAPATFRCPVHNQEVVSTPHNVLRGANPCSQCNHTQSKQEARIAEYLSMFTPTASRDRTVIKPKELDIHLPAKKLAVEYCGMYWHSQFNKEDVHKNRNTHFQKYTACAEQGIRLLTIYESEWQEREPAIRRLLRNAVGKGRGKLMARKCVLAKVPTAEARAFYEKYHPQGGAGGGEHYGLFWNTKLVACMRFSFGQNDRGTGATNRTWTLGRYATRVTVAGAASRLFKAFVQEYQPKEVKSFSDNRYFAGGMYSQLGFVLEQEVAPDYQVWSPKIGLRPKSHYQRRMLPQRLLDHNLAEAYTPQTDPRSEATMTYLMGCGRIYDCGKKRWVWTVAP